MKLVLTGATGFTGGEVLRQALEDASITEVLVLGRRPVGITHPKLRERLVDFLDYGGIDFSAYDACAWCLGVSQTKANEEEYIRITLDYAMAAAKAMFTANPSFRFCFVSGRSADPTEQKKTLYARIKGRTEVRLRALSENVFVFRPGYIRATARSVPRKDVGRFFAPISYVIDLFTENFSVDVDVFARALLDVAAKGASDHLFDNRTLRRWPGAG